MDELITTGLDQPLPLDNLDTLIDASVQQVNQLADRGQLDEIINYIRTADGVVRYMGVSLAVTFYQMQSRWESLTGTRFESVDDRNDHFEQTIFERLGKSKHTVRRYVMAGSMLTSVGARIGRLPEGMQRAVTKGLAERPVIDLIAVAQYEREHGALTPTQLSQIAEAEDRSTVRRLLRGYRGEEEPEGRTYFGIDLGGTLYAHVNGTSQSIGFIRRDFSDDFRRQCVEQFLRHARIQED